MFVSVTRLRLRSFPFFPAFAWHTWVSTRQVQHTLGFLGGQFAVEGTKGYWTITGWTDEADMHHYRNNDAHKRVMPKLLNWCDEASVVHWQQDHFVLPKLAEALDCMVKEGRLSKVRYPSPAHANKHIAPVQGVLRMGLSLRPIAGV